MRILNTINNLIPPQYLTFSGYATSGFGPSISKNSLC